MIYPKFDNTIRYNLEEKKSSYKRRFAFLCNNSLGLNICFASFWGAYIVIFSKVFVRIRYPRHNLTFPTRNNIVIIYKLCEGKLEIYERTPAELVIQVINVEDIK